MKSTPEDEHRLRLGRLIEAQRVELRMTQAQLAAAIPMSKEGLRKLVTGTGAIRELTKRGIEDALHWEPGGVDAVLAGGDPVVSSDGSPPTARELLADHLQERMATLGLDVAGLAEAAGMSEDRVQAICKGDVPFATDALALEQGLRWAPGSVAAILGRGDPVPLESQAQPRQLEEVLPLIGPIEPDEFDLGSRPPYPEPKDELEEAVNESWRSAKHLERNLYRRRGSLSERQMRVGQQYLLALKALEDEFGDAG